MKKILLALAATTAIGLTANAYAADSTAQADTKVDYKKNGGYDASSTAEQTNADGTKKVAKKSADVNVDSKGNLDETVKSETSSDAKGLMNAKKDTAKTTYKDKSNGGYKKTTTKAHVDHAGTDTKTENSTDVDVDSNGKTTEVDKTTNTTDPKGLMNKTSTTTKVKKVDGQVVEEKTSN